jgi:7 transmembrane helices usually fused to an inactive transglutaminase/Inactive transglutaminase fused to 7 transmembrane helices
LRNLHVKVLAALLVLVGVGLCYYKVTRLGLPLLPTEQAEVWTVEARIEFKARRDAPVKVRLAIPRSPADYTVVHESFVASSYGLTTEDDGLNRVAQWAVRKMRGWQVLYYRIQLARDPGRFRPPSPVLPVLAAPGFPEPMHSAVEAILAEVQKKSADASTFGRELLTRLNAPSPDGNVNLIRQDFHGPEDWAQRVVDLLAVAAIPARKIRVLLLKDGVSHGDLAPWIEVYDGQDWLPLNPETGDAGLPKESLVWQTGDAPSLEIFGGKHGKVEYSISRQTQEMTLIAEQRARQMGSRLMEFSLFSLPVQTQNVYRVLLLVPIGALLIVLLRNVIGISTFGTFMPILIALAFRETELLWGLILFILLVAFGLLIRFYLEYLKLLLVPRLASVLIIVILLMAAVGLVSHKLGIDRGLSVALFPMVILAMTIERMSLVWEELGPAAAFKQGFGSLLVAALGYLAMSSRYLGHLVFVFPELLLLVLAVTLLIGRYTGYRLLELWRFRAAFRG